MIAALPLFPLQPLECILYLTPNKPALVAMYLMLKSRTVRDSQVVDARRRG